MLDNLELKGELTLRFEREDGSVDEYNYNNLIVNGGFAYIASRMKDATATAMSHMAVGTSATAAGATQSALVTELARVALTSTTIVTTNVANDSVQYVATFPAGTATGAITEAGIFNASSAGTMLNRTVFSVQNKGASDSLTVTWKVTAQ